MNETIDSIGFSYIITLESNNGDHECRWERAGSMGELIAMVEDMGLTPVMVEKFNPMYVSCPFSRGFVGLDQDYFKR